MTARSTFWTAAPTRFAGLRRGRALIALALLAVLLAACLTAAAVSAFVLVQLHNPRSWLSRHVDAATILPAATS